MNADERLASIVTALESVGLHYLVMGGHAVRFYGLQRNTMLYPHFTKKAASLHP